MKQERKITEAEKKRTERFQKKSAEMKEEGYEESVHTVSIVKANILAVIIMLPFSAIIAVPYLMKYGTPQKGLLSTYLLDMALLIFLTMAEMAAHEGIHGLVWGLLAPEGFSAIEFGFIKEYLTPYCYCGSPLTKGQYLAGSVMPTLVLGFLQGAVSVWTGNFLVFMLAVILMIGGGGDFLVSWLIIRYKKQHSKLAIMDHPTELGFAAFEK